MTIFDFILLFIWAGFLFYGFFFGFIRTLGSLLGVIVGAWLASLFYLDFFNLIDPVFFGLDNVGKVISFLIVFIIITKIVSILVVIADKTFDIISIIPFLKTINRLLGAVLGFVEGVVVLGLIIYVLAVYGSSGGMVAGWLVNSQVVPHLLKLITVMLPFVDKIM